MNLANTITLKRAAIYGNLNVVKFMVRHYNLKSTTIPTTENLKEAFTQEASPLAYAFREFIMENNIDDDFLHSREALMDDWSFDVAPAVLGNMDYFENTDFNYEVDSEKMLGQAIRSECGNYIGVINFMAEMGMPVSWQAYDALDRLDETHPLKARVKELAAESPYSEVLVVNHFSPADFMEQRAQFTKGATTSDNLAAFHKQMDAIAEASSTFELIEKQERYCIFSGHPDELRKAAFNEFQDFFTEHHPRHMVEYARVANLAQRPEHMHLVSE